MIWNRRGFLVALFLLIAQLVLLPPRARAGGVFIGNGGEAVFRDGHWWLLDLVESGVDKREDFCEINTDHAESPMEKERLFFNEKDWKCFSRALHRLSAIHPDLTLGLWSGLSLFHWRYLNHPLGPVDHWNLDLPSETIVRTTALRYLNTVSIDQSIWRNMNAMNRSALILHELISASTAPVCSLTNTCEQHSRIIRQLVGSLYAQQPRAETSMLWRIYLNYDLPRNRGLRANERLGAGFVPFLENGFLQYGVVLLRSCDPRSGGPCGPSVESFVRQSYDSLLDRSPLFNELAGALSVFRNQDAACENVIADLVKKSKNESGLPARLGRRMFALRQMISPIPFESAIGSDSYETSRVVQLCRETVQ